MTFINIKYCNTLFFTRQYGSRIFLYKYMPMHIFLWVVKSSYNLLCERKLLKL
jgi:hypothetical protein